MSWNNIKCMSKEQFKSLVKVKCKAKAFNHLIKEKEKKSKLKKLTYKNIEMKKILVNKKYQSKEKTTFVQNPKQNDTNI